MTAYRIYVFGLLLLFVVSCAKKVPVSYNNIAPGHYVYATLTSGETVEGEIKTKDKNQLEVVTNDRNSSKLLLTREILRLSQKPSVYDEANQIIPESLIKQNQQGTNKWLFTLGGSALSFGVSFFLTANILHQTSDETEGGALWGPTVAGAAIGGVLFGMQGNKLDRQNSIEKLRERRKVEAIKKMKHTKKKRSEVQKQLKNLKKQRQEQNEEINRLLKKINKKKEE